jgi:transcriptional regulator with XRE-family HTH domain
MMPEQLGETIRARRIALGLTQEQLAERIGDGVRQAEVSRLEAGRVVQPRRSRLEKIALALDLPMGELLARSGWADDGSVVHRKREGLDAVRTEKTDVEVGSPRPLPPEIQRLRAAIDQSRKERARTNALVDQIRARWGPVFGYESELEDRARA